MTADIITFPGLTSLDIEPAQILESAKNSQLSIAIICGVDEEGEQYLASSTADAAKILWNLERAKWLLMNLADEQDEE